MSPDQARMLVMAGPMLLELFGKQEADCVNKIYGEFKAGKTDFLVRIAELAAIRDQINNIKGVLRTHNKGET